MSSWSQPRLSMSEREIGRKAMGFALVGVPSVGMIFCGEEFLVELGDLEDFVLFEVCWMELEFVGDV